MVTFPIYPHMSRVKPPISATVPLARDGVRFSRARSSFPEFPLEPLRSVRVSDGAPSREVDYL